MEQSGTQRELAGVKAGFFVRPIEEVSRASVVLAASDWGETAREDAKLENDIYTHFFVEALRIGADRNGDGAVTVSEAHDYARRMTYEYTNGRQRPSAETAEVGADPIVLVGRVLRRRAEPARPRRAIRRARRAAAIRSAAPLQARVLRS